MPLNAQKHLGDDWKFMFPKFACWGETPAEAEAMVKNWMIDFIAEVKAKKNKVDDVPFADDLHSKKKKQPTELPAEMAGVKLPY